MSSAKMDSKRCDVPKESSGPVHFTIGLLVAIDQILVWSKHQDVFRAFPWRYSERDC